MAEKEPDYQAELRALVRTQHALGETHLEMVRAQRKMSNHLWWVALWVKVSFIFMALAILLIVSDSM